MDDYGDSRNRGRWLPACSPDGWWWACQLAGPATTWGRFTLPLEVYRRLLPAPMHVWRSRVYASEQDALDALESALLACESAGIPVAE